MPASKVPPAPTGVVAAPTVALELDRFLPYRLSVLSNRASSAISRVYSERFGLGVTEWRVMAVVGHSPGLSAGGVAERTAMDKVAVSRAVARLGDRGLLQREVHDDDRRRSVLALSEAGHAVHDDIVPLALAFEQSLLGGMDAGERALLFRLLDRLDELELQAEAALTIA
ncbi:MAG: MarR family winged helix-turn-helix transcriptional regulator [Luteimonas sp.]